jgi:hypothetical protein
MGLQYKKETPAPDGPARTWLWGPSVSDNFVSTSPEDLDELADLVDSFYDSDLGEPLKEDNEGLHSLHETDGGDLTEMLDALLEEIGDEMEVGQIRVEVERALRAIGLGAREDGFFKERIVDRLRKRGFDAGM